MSMFAEIFIVHVLCWSYIISLIVQGASVGCIDVRSVDDCMLCALSIFLRYNSRVWDGEFKL